MAKKAESTLLNMFLSLTAIAVVAAAVLASVSHATADPIAQAKKAKQENAIKAVLPPFSTLETSKVKVEGIGDSLSCHSAYNEAHTLVGVAVEAYSEKGFGGRLGVMYGFRPDGTINGYQVVQTAETPGLGAKAGEWFQQGNKGDVIGQNPAIDNLTVKKDGGSVDAISGSTITSRAFCDAIATAHKAYLAVSQ